MTDTTEKIVFGRLIKREEGLAAPTELYRLAITDDLYNLNELKSQLREQIARGKVSMELYQQTKVLAELLFDFFEPFLDESYAKTEAEKVAYEIFKRYMDCELPQLGRDNLEKALVVYHVSRVLLRFAAKRRLTNIFQLTDERIGD